MFGLIRSLNLRGIVLVALLLGTLFGAISVSAWDNSSSGWKCPDGGMLECRALGCVKSSGNTDAFWVCRYAGDSCPPLEACVNNGVIPFPTPDL